METNNKLREALEKIAHYADNRDAMDDPDCADGHILADIAKTALAAPPRNCDAMDWRTAWKIWREKFLPETPVGYSAVVKGTEAFMDWFTAPAQA